MLFQMGLLPQTSGSLRVLSRQTRTTQLVKGYDQNIRRTESHGVLTAVHVGECFESPRSKDRALDELVPRQRAQRDRRSGRQRLRSSVASRALKRAPRLFWAGRFQRIAFLFIFFRGGSGLVSGFPNLTHNFKSVRRRSGNGQRS